MKPLRKSDILVKELGDETLLYSAEGKSIHVLNRTAGLIWQLCDGEHSLPEIEAAIRSQFAVPAEQDVAGDIQRTLDELHSKELLLNQT